MADMENDIDEALEDGELEECEPYEPLQRPPISQGAMDTKCDNDDSDTSESDDEDSDSELPKLKKPKRIVTEKKKNKYNVWSTELQESELMDDICKLDPGLKNAKMDKSRAVESYFFLQSDDEDDEDEEDDEEEDSSTDKKVSIKDRLGHVDSESSDCFHEKKDTNAHIKKTSVKDRLGVVASNCAVRNFLPEHENRLSSAQRSNKRRLGEGNFSCQRMKRSEETIQQEMQPRILSALTVTAANSAEEVAQEIIIKLCEEKEDLVRRIVGILGQAKAIDLFEKTKTIEEKGGMMVMNGSRRRTPGGVFLLMIKDDSEITQKQRRDIFEDERKADVRNKKKKSKASRLQKVDQLKKSLVLLEEQDLPKLLSRKEVVLQKHTSPQASDEIEPETVVKNPPPSPATEVDLLEDDDDIFDHDEECIEFM